MAARSSPSSRHRMLRRDPPSFLNDRRPLLAEVATSDAAARSTFVAECPAANQSRPQLAGCRLMHHPKLGLAIYDQANVDRIIVPSAHELLGSVQRVDEKIAIVVRRNAAGGSFFFGNHRHARRGRGK